MRTKIHIPDAEDWEEHTPPCPPDSSCVGCAAYWDLMRSDGFWVDGTGWTAKGLKAMKP